MKAKDQQDFSRKVLSRDGYRCQLCGSQEGRLVAHHIKAKKQYPKKALDTNNGTTLCCKCHSQMPTQWSLFGNHHHWFRGIPTPARRVERLATQVMFEKNGKQKLGHDIKNVYVELNGEIKIRVEDGEDE